MLSFIRDLESGHTDEGACESPLLKGWRARFLGQPLREFLAGRLGCRFRGTTGGLQMERARQTGPGRNRMHGGSHGRTGDHEADDGSGAGTMEESEAPGDTGFRRLRRGGGGR
jgi:hypothetical protein